MRKNLELYGICLCTVILIFFLSTHLRVLIPRVISHRTLAGIRNLLDPPNTTKEILLHSRASANARLAKAFHLTNTFVTGDPAIHSSFFRQSRRLLHAADRDWSHFTRVASQAVELTLPDTSTPFHIFVRAVTLRTVIVGLLNPDAEMASLASSDIGIATDLITDIWILSKKPDQIQPHLLEMLNSSLRRILPGRHFGA